LAHIRKRALGAEKVCDAETADFFQAANHIAAMLL
jgi:hypothetical protein